MRTVLIISLLLSFFLIDTHSQTGSIKVSVNDIRHIQGSILATLFNSPDGFPEDSGKSLASKSVKVSASSQSFYFHNVPFGTYAVALVHDKNNNGKFDKNFLGIPREGYAVSNNIKGLSAPGYSDASFIFDSKEKKLELNLIYF